MSCIFRDDLKLQKLIIVLMVVVCTTHTMAAPDSIIWLHGVLIGDDRVQLNDAIESLPQLGSEDKEALTKILVETILEEPENELTRGKSFRALNKLDNAILPYAEMLLSHDNDSIRSGATRVIGDLQDPMVPPLLIKASRDSNEYVRMYAIR